MSIPASILMPMRASALSTIRILLEVCRIFCRARAARARCMPFTAPSSRRMVPVSMVGPARLFCHMNFFPTEQL